MGTNTGVVAETNRLRLRRLSYDDFPFLLKLFNDPRAMEYFPGLRNAEQTRHWIEFTLESYRKYGFGKWIIERKEDGRTIGHSGLLVISVDGVQDVEAGYFLDPEYWGHGYATEAALAVLKLGFEDFRCERIIAAINPKNLPSIDVAQRLKMKKEKSGTATAGEYSWKSDIYLMKRVEISEVTEEREIATARELFLEYRTWLELDLCFQGFDDELKSLPGDYVPPGGGLFLLRYCGTICGCVALRKQGEGLGEMKRLFVRPSFHGKGLGRALIETVIQKGKDCGYEKLRLDTLPKMQTAIALYREFGFKPIAPYRYNPVCGAEYYELDLAPGPMPEHDRAGGKESFSGRPE